MVGNYFSAHKAACASRQITSPLADCVYIAAKSV